VVLMKVALLQIEISEKLSAIENVLQKIGTIEADYAILPEMCYGGFNYKTIFDRSRNFNQVKDVLLKFALQTATGIIGTIPELEDGEIYNSMLYIDKDGLLKKKQRKHFLFKPNKEEKYFRPGTKEYVPVRLKDAVFGGAICYELRFPEIFRKQSFDGMQIAVVPAQWPASRIAHWKTLIQARAIENSCFLAAVNAIGRLNDMELGGNSMIVNPDGKVLKNLGKNREIAVIDINLDEIRKAREAIPSLEESKKEQFYGNC